MPFAYGLQLMILLRKHRNKKKTPTSFEFSTSMKEKREKNTIYAREIVQSIVIVRIEKKCTVYTL